jgi:hypothetical protein
LQAIAARLLSLWQSPALASRVKQESVVSAARVSEVGLLLECLASLARASPADGDLVLALLSGVGIRSLTDLAPLQALFRVVIPAQYSPDAQYKLLQRVPALCSSLLRDLAIPTPSLNVVAPVSATSTSAVCSRAIDWLALPLLSSALTVAGSCASLLAPSEQGASLVAQWKAVLAAALDLGGQCLCDSTLVLSMLRFTSALLHAASAEPVVAGFWRDGAGFGPAVDFAWTLAFVGGAKDLSGDESVVRYTAALVTVQCAVVDAKCLSAAKIMQLYTALLDGQGKVFGEIIPTSLAQFFGLYCSRRYATSSAASIAAVASIARREAAKNGTWQSA